MLYTFRTSGALIWRLWIAPQVKWWAVRKEIGDLMNADPTLQNSDSRHVAIRRGISIAFVIPRPVRNCAFQVFRCAPPIVGTAPCGCPSRIIGISHGTAPVLSPTDPQNNPQFLPRINAIFPDAEYNHSVDRSYGVLDFWGVVLLYTFMISIEVI